MTCPGHVVLKTHLTLATWLWLPSWLWACSRICPPSTFALLHSGHTWAAQILASFSFQSCPVHDSWVPPMVIYLLCTDKKESQGSGRAGALDSGWSNFKLQPYILLVCHLGHVIIPISNSSYCHLEKALVTHSSTLAWKILWTEEPGRLQSMGSLRIRDNQAISLSLFTFMHWRRKWQPTPVFLPGESQGWGSLVGCRLWGRTESDTTDVT